MNGNSCNVAYRFHIPDLTEQFRLGKYAVRILRKECKKIKFLGRKCLLLPIDPDSSRCLVDLDPTDLDNIILDNI